MVQNFYAVFENANIVRAISTLETNHLEAHIDTPLTKQIVHHVIGVIPNSPPVGAITAAIEWFLARARRRVVLYASQEWT